MESGQWTYVCACLTVAAYGSAVAFSAGGPVSVCSDPYPHHKTVVAQKSACPFELVASSTRYSSGSDVTVSFRRRPEAEADWHFTGFQLSAHASSGRWDDLQGEFRNTEPELESQLLYFFSSKANCVTHRSNSMKTSFSALWRAPSAAVGDITFSATIMKDYETFWVNVSTQIVSEEPLNKAALLPPVLVNPRDSRVSSLFSGCGADKTCLLWPRTCTNADSCLAVVAYSKVSTTQVRFQMAGPTSGYLSLGLSLDKKMDKDETLSCLRQDNGHLTFQRGYNPGYNNQRVTEDLVTNVSMHYENGKLYCEFIRPLFAYVNMTKMRKTVLYPFDLSENGKYYLYLGWGKLYPGSYDSLMIHEQLPIVAPNKMNLSSYGKYYFNSLPIEYQVHITFMLVAWLGLSSVASVVARYFRSSVLNATKLNGKVAWLQIHRGMTVFALSLTASGFALVFVYVDGWSKAAAIHAGFGVAVMALTVLQSVAAICRPRPTSSKRKAFAWIHRISGVVTWLCAAACMVLGVNISYMPPQLSAWGMGIVAAWIGCQVIFTVLLEGLQRCATTDTSQVKASEMQLEEKSEQDSEQIAKQRRSIVFVVYSLAISALLAGGVGLTWGY